MPAPAAPTIPLEPILLDAERPRLAQTIGLAAALPLFLAVGIERARDVDVARVELTSLRPIVGEEQIERALVWAGPSVDRLEAARRALAAGRTLSAEGEWSRALSMRRLSTAAVVTLFGMLEPPPARRGGGR